MKRLRVDVARLAGDVARLDGDAAHYLGRVLRVRPGELVELFDGEGTTRDGTVRAVEEGAVELDLGPPRPVPAAPPITIAQGLPKGDKLELVLQKATELGAARIVPLALERCVVRLAPEKAEERLRRWRKIAEEAARQCGRADVPEVEPVQPLDAYLAAAARRGEAVAILAESARGTAVRLGAWAAAHAGPLGLVVGPEGGLADAELEAARAAGATAVSLGSRVLRTETAPLAALAVVMFVAGELG